MDKMSNSCLKGECKIYYKRQPLVVSVVLATIVLLASPNVFAFNPDAVENRTGAGITVGPGDTRILVLGINLEEEADDEHSTDSLIVAQLTRHTSLELSFCATILLDFSTTKLRIG